MDTNNYYQDQTPSPTPAPPPHTHTQLKHQPTMNIQQYDNHIRTGSSYCQLVASNCQAYMAGKCNTMLHNNAFDAFEYHVFESFMENGAFAHWSKCSIFHNIFKSIQNFTYFYVYIIFQFCLTIDMMSWSKNSLWGKGLTTMELRRGNIRWRH